MHQKRQRVNKKTPIIRKGTKYVARASSDPENAVPVVVAVRDMLKLARNAKEVEKMIFQKLLKINGSEVRDKNEAVKPFNLLEAGKTYILKISPTRRFFFEEAKNKDERLCKVTSRTLLKGNKMQLNLHDGSNVLGDSKVKVGDSIILDLSGKIKKHIPLSEGKEVFVLSGKYEGKFGKVESLKDKKAEIKFEDKTAVLDSKNIIVL